MPCWLIPKSDVHCRILHRPWKAFLVRGVPWLTVWVGTCARSWDSCRILRILPSRWAETKNNLTYWFHWWVERKCPPHQYMRPWKSNKYRKKPGNYPTTKETWPKDDAFRKSPLPSGQQQQHNDHCCSFCHWPPLKWQWRINYLSCLFLSKFKTF